MNKYIIIFKTKFFILLTIIRIFKNTNEGDINNFLNLIKLKKGFSCRIKDIYL